MSQQRKNSSGGRLIRRCLNSDSTVIIPFIKFGPLFGQDEEGSSLKKAKEEAWKHVVSFSKSSTEAIVTENYIANDVSTLCKLRYLEAKVENNFPDFKSITSYMRTSTSNECFPQLKCLRLLNLSELQRIQVENTAMPILSDIEINNCQKLDINSIPTLPRTTA
ncbi:hypothetical protein KY289_015950 [Solanum tuberosum]|nr:hypothetical protein KY289_015950 [Solanum tuberosum]